MDERAAICGGRRLALAGVLGEMAENNFQEMRLVMAGFLVAGFANWAAK